MNFRIILLVFALFALVNCSKNDNPSSGSARIAIKGTISSGTRKSSSQMSLMASSLSDAKKILVFSSTGYSLFNIENGIVSAYALSGTATALAFLDNDNQFIGSLNAGGLNVLPLVSLRDGDNTIIDLGNLTLNETTVIPVNDPIGNEIDLNEDEINRYKALGSYYESLSKNIDADNDGVPDILVKKDFNLSTIFDILCGTMGLNSNGPQVTNPDDLYVDYTIRVAGGKGLIPSNQTITLSGPEGSPYTDIQQSRYSPAPDGFITGFYRRVQAPDGSPYPNINLPFMQGKYTITLDNREYTLNYSNIDAKYFLILALPTVHTNDNNEIVSVSVEYRDVNNNPVTAENFVFQTQVTLRNNGNILTQIGALWESPEAKTNTELYNFNLTDPIPLSSLTNMSVMYVDMIGNSYSFNFSN